MYSKKCTQLRVFQFLNDLFHLSSWFCSWKNGYDFYVADFNHNNNIQTHWGDRWWWYDIKSFMRHDIIVITLMYLLWVPQEPCQVHNNYNNKQQTSAISTVRCSADRQNVESQLTHCRATDPNQCNRCGGMLQILTKTSFFHCPAGS